MYELYFPARIVDIRTNCIFNKLNRSLVTRTSITLKFKTLWFPNEARRLSCKIVKKRYINIPYFMPEEDRNYRLSYGGSLVLYFRK